MRARLIGLCVLALAVAGPAAAQTETTEYYGTDAVGSVRIVFTPTGTVLGRQDYDPFGREILSAWGVPPERFGGQTADGEVQQAYFHARQVMGRTGRFGSIDPVFDGTADPQLWNRYTYARSNPLLFSDYTGLDIFCEEVNGSVICTDTGATVPGNPGFDGGGTIGGGDSPCALSVHAYGCQGDRQRDPHPRTTATPTDPSDPPKNDPPTKDPPETDPPKNDPPNPRSLPRRILDCAGEHYGLTAGAIGGAAAALPISKRAAGLPVVNGASESTNLISLIGHYLPIRMPFRLLGTTNGLRMVGRAWVELNPYVSVALLAYDSYEIGSCVGR